MQRPHVHHGHESRILYGAGREQVAEAGVPELPERVYGVDSVEGLHEATGIAARREQRRPREIRESDIVYGAAG